MKTPLIFLALATASFAGSQVLDQVSPEALAKLQQTSPMAALQQPAGESAKVIRPAGQSIIKQSSILHDGTHWTLVPKGAVVHTPEAMKGKVDVKPVGTLLSWSDFLLKNRGWITTADISFDQAAGNEPVPAERAAFWAKQDKIVVAVHQNGPISVQIATQLPALTQR
jgi:hypothetical protein